MNTLLSAFARRGRWLEARSLLDDMVLQEVGVFFQHPWVPCPNGMLCSTSGALKPSLPDVKVKQDIISFSCVITACEKGNAWEFAMQLLQQMQVVKVQLLVLSGETRGSGYYLV